MAAIEAFVPAPDRSVPDPNTEETTMSNEITRSTKMYLIQEVMARARMRRAPRWRSLPYRPALKVAASARRYR